MPEVPLILATDLNVRAGGVELVRIARLAVNAGEMHVVMGPNGAGKSTLLRALSGLTRAAGVLEFDGRAVRSAGDRRGLRRATASVFQKPYLLSTSVLGNVESGLGLRGVRGDERRRRALAALELLGIEHLAGRRRETLSGGEAQRVSIARALALEPRVLFLDEPMASLDPPTRRSLLADLFAVFSARTLSAVWVTHDREEAAAVADQVTFLSGGRVLQQGPAADVFAHPQTEDVAAFLGLESSIAGTVVAENGAAVLLTGEGERIVLGEAEVGPSLAFVFPEDVVLLLRPPEAGSTSMRNLIAGHVEDVSVRGRLRLVTVGHGDLRITALVTQAALEELGLRPGDAVVAGFKATAVHVLPCHAADRSSR